jgi:hypothetical protein
MTWAIKNNTSCAVNDIFAPSRSSHNCSMDVPAGTVNPSIVNPFASPSARASATLPVN